MSINYRGTIFDGYNQPKRTPTATKKSAVLAKVGDKVKLVRRTAPAAAGSRAVTASCRPTTGRAKLGAAEVTG